MEFGTLHYIASASNIALDYTTPRYKHQAASCCATSYYLVLPHLTFYCGSLPYLTSQYPTSTHITLRCTISRYIMLCYFPLPYLNLPHLILPNLTTHYTISPHITSDCIALHYIALHYATSWNLALPYITAYCIAYSCKPTPILHMHLHSHRRSVYDVWLLFPNL